MTARRRERGAELKLQNHKAQTAGGNRAGIERFRGEGKDPVVIQFAQVNNRRRDGIFGRGKIEQDAAGGPVGAVDTYQRPRGGIAVGADVINQIALFIMNGEQPERAVGQCGDDERVVLPHSGKKIRRGMRRVQGIQIILPWAEAKTNVPTGSLQYTTPVIRPVSSALPVEKLKLKGCAKWICSRKSATSVPNERLYVVFLRSESGSVISTVLLLQLNFALPWKAGKMKRASCKLRLSTYLSNVSVMVLGIILTCAVGRVGFQDARRDEIAWTAAGGCIFAHCCNAQHAANRQVMHTIRSGTRITAVGGLHRRDTLRSKRGSIRGSFGVADVQPGARFVHGRGNRIDLADQIQVNMETGVCPGRSFRERESRLHWSTPTPPRRCPRKRFAINRPRIRRGGSRGIHRLL